MLKTQKWKNCAKKIKKFIDTDVGDSLIGQRPTSPGCQNPLHP